MSTNAHILIYHGDDISALNSAVAAIEQAQKQTGMADMNFSVLDGRTVNMNDFTNVTLSAPFMMNQRVVILNYPLAMAGGKDGNAKFQKLLEGIPSFTLLYLIIPDTFERKDWTTINKSHFLRKWVEKHKDIAELSEFQLPSLNAMPSWIMKKAMEKGGRFDASGASALSAAIGNDTQLAEHEIEKLLLYVDFTRPVDSADVDELVTGIVTVSIFDMVDALVLGNSRVALTKLHQLMAEQEIPQLFAMIIRQFRLLVQTRDIMDRGGRSAEVQSELSQQPFVADKLCRQASAFTMKQLKNIYAQLLELDYTFKSSQGDPAALLDVFVLEVAKMLKK